MADGDCMSQLGGWEGYRVEDWHHEQRAGRRWLVLELRIRFATAVVAVRR